MGFDRRKMEDERRRVAEKEAANRRATDPQILEDAEQPIAAWNERQAKRMPMLFSPTIGRHRGRVLVPVSHVPRARRARLLEGCGLDDMVANAQLRRADWISRQPVYL
jgi:hypothetical protein